MSQQEPPRPDPVDQVGTWASRHVEVQANFEGVPVLLVGDPHILSAAPPISGEVPQDPWGWLKLPSGRALTVRGPGSDQDGPWVWVLASDDGPLSSVEISPWLEDAPPGAERERVGTIEAGSRRIVIGAPESIAAWGRDVDTEAGRAAEMRVNNDVPGPLRLGYIVVVRLPAPGDCDVFVVPGARSGGISGISIQLPTPSWLPPARPIIDPPNG
jgi:hypothetical protein